MAKKDKAKKKEEGTEEESAGGGKKKLILIIVGVLILVGGAVGGTLMFMGGGEPEVAEGEAEVEEEPKDIGYLKFTKPVVINYQAENGKTHFLKAGVTLMTEEEDRLDDIEKHLPKIQHTVNVVFSRQKFEDIRTVEGKEKMRVAALEEVQRVLAEEMGDENVDDLLYTGFVTQ